jgi:CubicO group peptidase (beta-lactamase class C family)
MRTLILIPALAGCTTGVIDIDEGEFECGPTHAWHVPDPAYHDLRAHFEDRFAESGLQGAALALLKDGEIVFAAAAGERDPEAGEPMTVRTRARNGSTLKMQTAAALLHQQDLGVLSVQDGIHDWLPDLDLAPSPGHMAEVTLHHLISHQGGFYDYTPVVPEDASESAEAHAYGFFADNVYALAPAGSFYNYSNPNFSLAGLVASKAADTDYDTLMQETVFEPLCMSRATFDPEVVAADDVWATAQYPDYWTSEGEYDAVLSDGARTDLVTGQVPVLEAGDHAWYGYGVLVQDGLRVGNAWYDTPVWQHSGGLIAYTTLVYTLPEEGVSAAILQVGDGEWLIDVLLEALLGATDLAPTTPPQVPYDPAVLDAAVGTYVDPFNVGTLEVTRVDDTLHIDAPKLDEYDVLYADTLYWYGHANFVWVVDGGSYGITFVDDDGDLDNGFRWFRNRVFVAERDPMTRAMRPSRPPRLAPAPLP